MILTILFVTALLIGGLFVAGRKRGADGSGPAIPPDGAAGVPAPQDGDPRAFRLGRIRDSNRFFELDDDRLSMHMTVLGRTGMGKSRLLEQLVLEHIERRRAAVVLDPDGDLVENVLGRVTRHVVETGSRAVLKRIDYLEPGPFLAFAYDPFVFRLHRPVHPELLASVREAWLHCKVDRVADILLRKQGQQSYDGMPRLQRVLRDVLYVVGTLVAGRRLALADATLILDFGHPLNARLWAQVEPHLPRDVASDFRVLREMRRIEDLRRETESTLNRLRSMFGPVVRSIFSRTEGPSLSLYDAIQNGHVVLVNLRDSEYLSPDQASALGRMLIYDALTTAMVTPREQRRPCTLIVDEAAEFVTPDIGRALRRMRKYQLGVVLSSQTIESFVKDDCDLRSIVLGQPDTVLTFNQRWPEDLALLARILFTRRLDFTPLWQEVERDGGTEFVPLLEYGFSKGTGHSWNDSATRSTSRTDSAARTDSQAQTISLAHMLGWGLTRTDGQSEVETDTTSTGKGTGVNHEIDSQLGLPVREGQRHSSNTNESAAKSRGRQRQAGTAETENGATTITNAEQRGVALQRSAALQQGESTQHGTGGNENESTSWSLRWAQIRKTIREQVETGQLRQAVADQLESYIQQLFSLGRRQAAVLSGTESFFLETLEVPDAFASPEALMKAVEWAKLRLRELHPYLFVPDLSQEEEERRVRAYLGVGAAVDDPDADDPVIVAESADNPLA